ncbi:four-helix bundle copper-binding protein [Olivibacter sitiensis]|uniref:four-helix bundle copper-binding protein n=1 Tax=Olivibacter sitiensis TaxID=376470 RepID=UPI0005641DF8|nr:four-helix bundle copper-binding protein [Olivibacter sitiensis]
MKQQMKDALVKCIAACDHCATSCLEEEHVAHMVDCIRADQDCADICNLALRLLQRESNLATQFLLLCEEACRKCEAICRQHDNEHCQACADACLACAELCHEHHTAILQD